MRRLALAAFVLAGTALLAWSLAAGQQAPRRGTATASTSHGDPRGWKFTLPSTGDRVRGRAAFEKFECFACHEVRGEKFPGPTKRETLGPELASMTYHHSPSFLAEAIINPGAWIDPGKGYAQVNGSSKMPSFADSMTVQELIDLIAFLRGLAPPGQTHHHE